MILSSNVPMSQLEQLILGLVICSSISNGGYAQLCILNSIVFRTTFTQGTSIKSNNSRMSKVGILCIQKKQVRSEYLRMKECLIRRWCFEYD